MPPSMKKGEKEAKKVEEVKKDEKEAQASQGTKRSAEEAGIEEPPKFVEPDAPEDKRKVVQETVAFDAADTTLNVVPILGGKVFATITDGGMHCLMAGARANVGVKAGRYMFEAKIIQVTAHHAGDKQTGMRLRVGFSTAESTLVMPDQAISSVYFDSDGFFCADKKRKGIKGSNFGKEQVVAVVLNLDSKSPNFNTVALYRDGVALGAPQPLPDDLKDKALFPSVTYRGCTVQVNFGPAPIKDLPFKCRTVQSAATSDVTVVAAKTAKDGKCEVVLPVAFPDEGTFDWLDGFLEKNPKYVELSDRKIVEWAKLSGLNAKPHHGKNNSNDRPSIDFGVPALNDFSVRKVIAAVAPVMPRNYVVMEVKSNLLANERKELLKKFSYPKYKKVARVVMGEPDSDFKEKVQSKILKDKQNKAEIAWKKEKAEKAKKKQQEKSKKEAEKRKKEVEKKKAELAEKKKKEEEEKKKKKEEGDKKEEEEKKEEPKEEEKPKEDEKMEEEKEEEAEEDTEPPKVELTDEEKDVKFFKKALPDVAPQVIASTFGRFTTPAQDEGFDDIQYEWFKGDKADSYLKEWVLKQKRTTRIEDLKPGEYFKDKKVEFTKLKKEWQEKLKAHKASGKKKVKTGEAEEEGVDIFSVTDVMDVGDGIPLFEHFTTDDWQLTDLRFELGLMVAAFKQDANDDDRTGIPLDHLGFYYSRYFSKPFESKRYGFPNNSEVITMVKDTVSIADGILTSSLGEEIESLDIFLKLSEEHRRERQRRIDAGDETARLKFMAPQEAKPAAPKPDAKPQQKKEEKKQDKGKDKGGKAGGKSGNDAPKVVAGYGSKGKDKGKDKGGKDKGKGKGWW